MGDRLPLLNEALQNWGGDSIRNVPYYKGAAIIEGGCKVKGEKILALDLDAFQVADCPFEDLDQPPIDLDGNDTGSNASQFACNGS